MLTWSIAATFIPFVPGSYAGKGAAAIVKAAKKPIVNMTKKAVVAARKVPSVAKSFKWMGGKRGEIVHKSKNFRFAPLGHGGTKEAFRQLPHYHRRGPGGIGQHRPWQGFNKESPHAGKWWRRF